MPTPLEVSDNLEAALPELWLDVKQTKQLQEGIYTLSEAGTLENRVSEEDAMLIIRLWMLIKANGFKKSFQL